jgi:serine/alanine adding enzyme
MKLIPDFQDFDLWDRYVEAHPEGRFCHLSAYRCLQQVYGYKPQYMAFMQGDRIAGVLPAFAAKSLFFGKRLVSQPFSEYGGLLLDPDLTPSDVAEIFGQLREFVRANNFPAVEMHGRQGAASDSATAYLTRANDQHYAVLPLDRPLDEIYAKVCTYEVRKAVQKAQRSGVTVEERSDPDTLRRDFYPFYLNSMKRLGAPPHSAAYYLECQKAFGPRMRIFWAIHEGKPIAGLLGFTCGARVNIINIVSDSRSWNVRPNDLIHWEYIQWAYQQGCRYFDFGSVRYEGQLHYKKKWGCIISDHAYYFVNAKEAAPVATFNSSSSTMKTFSELWSKYMPRPGELLLGPFLRKNLIR